VRAIDNKIFYSLPGKSQKSESGKAARKRWINTISHDLISLNLTPVDVED